MLKQLPGGHVANNIFNEVATHQQTIVWLITILAAIAGVGYLKRFAAYLFYKLYELIIQQNIFNL